MNSTTDMFEQDENRKAFDQLLERNRNGAKDMFHYQTPYEQLKERLYKGALAKMVDEAMELPGRIETALSLLSELGSPEEVKDIMRRLGLDSDKMISKEQE